MLISIHASEQWMLILEKANLGRGSRIIGEAADTTVVVVGTRIFMVGKFVENECRISRIRSWR